jgi:hypothetical protein
MRFSNTGYLPNPEIILDRWTRAPTVYSQRVSANSNLIARSLQVALRGDSIVECVREWVAEGAAAEVAIQDGVG